MNRKKLFYLLLSFLLNVLTDGDDMIALATRIGEWIGSVL